MVNYFKMLENGFFRFRLLQFCRAKTSSQLVKKLWTYFCNGNCCLQNHRSNILRDLNLKTQNVRGKTRLSMYEQQLFHLFCVKIKKKKGKKRTWNVLDTNSLRKTQIQRYTNFCCMLAVLFWVAFRFLLWSQLFLFSSFRLPRGH